MVGRVDSISESTHLYDDILDRLLSCPTADWYGKIINLSRLTASAIGLKLISGFPMRCPW